MSTFQETMEAAKVWLQDDASPRMCLLHDDLDGKGNRIVVETAALLTTRSLTGIHQPRPIDFRECRAGHAHVTKAIMDWVTELESDPLYEKGKRRIGILITDHSGFKQEEVCLELAKRGHRFYIVVIDHHKDLRSDREKANTTLDMSNCSIEPAYFTDPAHSATWWTYKMLVDSIPMDERSARAKRIIEALGKYVEAVSTYDTGKWPDWDPSYKNPYEELDPSIREQFITVMCNNSEDYNFLIKHRLGAEADLNYLSSSPGNRTKLQKDLDRVVDIALRSMVDAAWYRLVTEYEWVLKNKKIVRDASSGIRFLDTDRSCITVDVGHSYTVMIVDVAENERVPRFYSMIFKKILEDPNGQHIDLIMLINRRRGTVELRSASDSVSCADIAIRHGGGGHPRAAGFPFRKNN